VGYLRVFDRGVVSLGYKLSVTSWIFCMLFLGTLAGCGAGGGGGDDKAPSGAQKGAVVKTIQVKETEFKLEPAEITLDKPGTYVFKAVNSGDTVHALEVEGEGIEEETEEIEPGQSAELEVKLKAGTYELYCPVGGHAQEGMEGKLTVKEGSEGSGGSGGY
jgi:plastocyanin